MPARDLPNNPNLEHLRNQAKTMQETVRSGDGEAANVVREFHPRLTNIPDGAAALTAFALADARVHAPRPGSGGPLRGARVDRGRREGAGADPHRRRTGRRVPPARLPDLRR